MPTLTNQLIYGRISAIGTPLLYKILIPLLTKPDISTYEVEISGWPHIDYTSKHNLSASRRRGYVMVFKNKARDEPGELAMRRTRLRDHLKCRCLCFISLT